MKILISSDDPRLPTGYANAVRNIATGLIHGRHEVVFAAQMSMDQKVEQLEFCGKSLNVYGYGKGVGPNVAALSEIHKIEGYDYLITLCDWQTACEQMLNFSGTDMYHRWIHASASDGAFLTTTWDYPIRNMPMEVFMSPKFGYEVTKNRRFGYCKYIPLGTDHNIFKPLPAASELKKNLKERLKWPQDCKIVLTVARNQYRKNYPEIIRAAAISKKTRYPGKYRFVLHCCPVESCGWDLPQLLHYYDVADVVAISDQPIKPEKLAELYNTADMFLLPSAGEGFGIPLVEAAMCELPIITTNATANKDLSEILCMDKFNLNYTTQWQNGPTLPRPFVSAEEILAKIDWVAEGYSVAPQRLNKICAIARQAAISRFSNEIVQMQWQELVMEFNEIREMIYGKRLYFGGKVIV